MPRQRLLTLHQVVNIAVEASVLAYAQVNPAARTGIYFVLRDLLLTLIRRPDVNLSLAAHGALQSHLATSVRGGPLEAALDPARRSRLGEAPFAFIAPHTPAPPAIFTLPRVTVFQIVHDLAAHACPAVKTEKDFEAAVMGSLARQGHALCVSEHTRRDAIRHFNLPASRATVIYPALRSDIPYGVQVRNGWGAPYMFALVGMGARKNLPTTVKAFIEASRLAPELGLELLIAGVDPSGEQAAMIADVVPDDLRPRVRQLGYAADQDLPQLLGDALCLVFPSLYEGFGMPLLEAMACGTPIVASNAGSIPEVAGEAAILTDPMDAAAVAQAAIALARNPQERARWAAKGLERVKAFSWETSVDALIATVRKHAV